MAPLVWSDSILDDAQQVRRHVATALSRARIPGELTVTGPAGTPGVLTKGDLDLHLRAPVAEFDDVVRRLSTHYPPTSEDAWATTLAVFDLSADRPAGLAVTPIGSEHDLRFRRSWRRLGAEPELLAEYNALKAAYFETEEYEARKSAFFDRITA